MRVGTFLPDTATTSSYRTVPEYPFNPKFSQSSAAPPPPGGTVLYLYLYPRHTHVFTRIHTLTHCLHLPSQRARPPRLVRHLHVTNPASGKVTLSGGTVSPTWDGVSSPTPTPRSKKKRQRERLLEPPNAPHHRHTAAHPPLVVPCSAARTA
jgi:hypothetical protein